MVFRVAKGIYFWITAVFLTIGFFSAVMLTHFWLLTRGRGGETRPLHRICSLWGRTLLWITPGWQVQIIGAENIPVPDEPMVVVANHESMADIWAMFCLDLQFRWLSKDSIFRIPFVGPAMRWAGYVPISRGNRESHAQAMIASVQRLRTGLSMFYFPEGTRSKDGVMKTFKTGAFKLARDEQVRILPIAIHGARQLLPKGAFLPGKAVVKVQVLPPLPPPAPGEQNLESVAALVREQILAVHNRLL